MAVNAFKRYVFVYAVLCIYFDPDLMKLQGTSMFWFLRFIDKSPDIKSSQSSGISRGMALLVVEVGRHGYHGIGDVPAQEVLCHRLHTKSTECSL